MEYINQKTVLFYSGTYEKNAYKDMEWFAKKFNELGIKTKVYPGHREIITEKVRIRFCSDLTNLKGRRVDEVFRFDEKTAQYLRKNHSTEGFKGTLTNYVVLAHTMGTV